MAAPISAVPKEVYIRNEEQAVSTGGANASPAIDKVAHILEELDKAGWLDVLTAAVEQRDSLLGILVDQANKPGAVQAVKSVVSLSQVVSSLDVASISALGKGIASGINELEQGSPLEVKGIWDVLKASRDPDVSRAFSAILTILKSVGEHLGRGAE